MVPSAIVVVVSNVFVVLLKRGRTVLVGLPQ
jgi:hypothetical protein